MSVRSTAVPFHHECPAPLAGSGRDSVEQRRVFQIYVTKAMTRPVPTARVSAQNEPWLWAAFGRLRFGETLSPTREQHENRVGVGIFKFVVSSLSR